jgi:hypothetical protein
MDIHENTGDIGLVKASPGRDTISGGLIEAEGAIIRVCGRGPRRPFFRNRMERIWLARSGSEGTGGDQAGLLKFAGRGTRLGGGKGGTNPAIFPRTGLGARVGAAS